MAEQVGTWWIWKVFWILLVITGVEVVLGIIKPEIMLGPFLGTSILNIVFIVLTLVKAGYIVQVFMHVKYEKKALKYALYLPSLILIPYLTFILLTEGTYLFT
ncbi:MAG: cytochrome C oxidase subunit IV family protein [Schleiferiaceae bacterium]|jgi:cytochrome c oxidase subunit IV|nr:cytochrome C oxidase subunit IV family protein [Schleiferiaceae bacterium]PSR07691.1 MAG: cytochrome C oxidase subunit IV [Bacteroidota bacterium]